MHALHQAKPIAVSRTGVVHGGLRKTFGSALTKLRKQLIALVRTPAKTAAERTARKRDQTRLSIWALGYSGLSREAARLFREQVLSDARK